MTDIRAGLALSLLGTLGLATACRSRPAPPVVPAICATPAVDIEGSREQAPGFSIVLPPEFKPVPRQGIDSSVGEWADQAGHRITYDYGAYPVELQFLRSGLAGLRECQETIGGHSVILVAGYDTAGTMSTEERTPKYVAVASWRDLPERVNLTVGGTSLDPEGLRRVVAIIRTVRIR